MFYQIFLTFLLFSVYEVSAISSFFNKGDRAEFFELTDNEVAVFRVNLPDYDFQTLKERADVGGFGAATVNVTETLGMYRNNIIQTLEILKKCNFKELYPNYNFGAAFPALRIDANGNPNIDTEEILAGFDLNPRNYITFDYVNDNFSQHALRSNSNFDMMKLRSVLADLEINPNAKVDPSFKKIVDQYKYAKMMNAYYEEDDTFDFKSKNATMTVELNGKKVEFNKVNFALGGQSSRYFAKPGYNIKIRGGDELFGRKQFKLRSDADEASYLRTKIASDIHNRLGLPSLSANYVTLYINNEYMGLFIITDTFKPSWIEYKYNEKDTKSLYQCDGLYTYLTVESGEGCTNEDKEATDRSEFNKLLVSISNAQSAADIESIFDVDLFLKEIALEYLFGSWDHFLYFGHNFYMYQQPNGQWQYFMYDFDLDFGQAMDRVFLYTIPIDLPEVMDLINTDYPSYSFEDFSAWVKDNHLLNILIFKDPSRFEKIIKDIVSEVFNPATLFPHIDEIKKFIQPYVKKDKTPGPDGKLPGCINTSATYEISYEQWNANTEFTSVDDIQYFGYGVKYWILEKYRNICKTYGMSCDPVYMDENYSYPINKNVEFKGYFPNYEGKSTTTTTTTTTTATETKLPMKNEENTIRCWSELDGSPCCPPDVTTVYYTNEYGDWGFDFSKGQWCGLTLYEEAKQDEVCWSEKLGYGCCKGCRTYYEDNNGKWGFEANQWCGIQSFCKN